MLVIKSIFKIVLFISFILNYTIRTYSIEASDKSSEKIEFKNFEQTYILGPGDITFIEFVGIPELSNNYIIDASGSFILPEIGYFNVEGKTIVETKSILLEEFSNYIFEPQINIYVVQQKVPNVLVKGEVNRPGLYALGNKELSGQLKNSSTNNSFNSLNKGPLIQAKTLYMPKLFDAIQKGDGITINADLTNIIVTRKNPLSSGGGKIQTTINLLSLLEEGDLTQNITLRDGDVINVQRSNDTLLDQLISTNKTNLAPKTINVFVNGNVYSPGAKTLRQNSSLLEAIASAGGNQTNSGNIEFIRLNKQGKTTKRVFRYVSSSKKGSFTNPILMSGDIIFVRKNIIAKSTEMIDTLARPVISSYGLYKIFD